MDRFDNMGNWIEQIKTLLLEQIPVTEPERQYKIIPINADLNGVYQS